MYDDLTIQDIEDVIFLARYRAMMLFMDYLKEDKKRREGLLTI